MPAQNKHIGRLGFHGSGGSSSELPPRADFQRHLRIAVQDGKEHWTMRPYGTYRIHHPHDGQAYLRDRGRLWNVARALLQHEGRRGRSFVNTCGYVECVKPDHWKAVGRDAPLPSRGFSLVERPKGWELHDEKGLVKRLRLLPARLSDANVVHHVVAMPMDSELTSFAAVCKAPIDVAAMIIEVGMDATCEACLR